MTTSNPFVEISERLDRIEKAIAALKIGFNISDDTAMDREQPLTTAQAAALLNIATATIYSYTFRKLIPFIKKGGRNYFFKSDLIAWLKKDRIKTIAEIQLEAEDLLCNKRKTRN